MTTESTHTPQSLRAQKSLGKFFTVLLIAVLFLSSASAVLAEEPDYTRHYVTLSHIPKPSVPQFTIKLVDYSYDVPSNTTIKTDPYNGNTTTTTTPGYHVALYKLEIKIISQSYPTSIDNNTFQLYYKLDVKGHFENWSTPKHDFTNTASTYFFSSYQNEMNSLTLVSSSDYTIITRDANYRVGDQVDFRITAILGNIQTIWNTDHIFPSAVGNEFTYCSSGWSQTETFTMPDTSSPIFTADKPTPTPTATTTPAPTFKPTTTPQPTTTTPSPTEIVTTTSTPYYTNYPTATLTPTERIEQTGALIGFNWQTIIIAAVGGVIVGLVVALALLKRSHNL